MHKNGIQKTSIINTHVYFLFDIKIQSESFFHIIVHPADLEYLVHIWHNYLET